MKYWINTVSRDHVLVGQAGGFTQANHGRSTNLRRLAKGDLIAFYSPRTHYPDGVPLQCFTAIARVVDDQPYQVEMSATFHPWRRRVDFLPCQSTAIQPLIARLEFIADKQHWGFPFRRGLFSIGETDFQVIAEMMAAELVTA